MPKSLDKTKGARKRKISPTNSITNTESDGSETKQGQKKKRIQKKRSSLEGIEMSKQLAAEIGKKRTVRSRNATRKTSSGPRLLGNGKPMPSLADLEAMYEDSDDDECAPKPTTTAKECSTPTTPTRSKPIVTNGLNLDSPETLKEITSKVIDIISKKVELIEQHDDGPPLPVIPQKKPKKSDTPYIVGCTERDQVPWAPKTKFCVGFDDYGIKNKIPDEEEEKKRKKRGQPINISKSIFNAKSDEIAEKLKELDAKEPSRTGSPDSNKTIEYDFPSNSPRTMLRSFSPLPSTSKDSQTIQKNDELFNESLQSESLQSESIPKENNQNNSQDDIEIIDIPCETVVIDDSLPNTSIKSEKRAYIDLDDDCCIIVEPEIKKKRYTEKPSIDESPPKDDIYGSIDLTQTFDNEVYEINDDDIDNLIAENKAILEKDLNKNCIDTVTAVDPNVIILDSESKNSEQPSTSNANNPKVVCHPPSNVVCVEMGTETDTDTNVAPTQASHNSRGRELSDVLTKFFSSENMGKPPENLSTVDLTSTSCQDTMMSRISSWIYSIESFLSGRHNRQSSNTNASNEVVVVDDVVPSVLTPENTGLETYLNSPRSHKHQKNRGDARCSARESSHLTTQRAMSMCPAASNSCCFPGPPADSSSIQRELDTRPSTNTTQQQTSTSVLSQPSPPRRSLGDCPICMDSLANSAVASTMCGHVFCMPCIKAAIRTNGKRCPTCRKVLKGAGGGFHQLFI